MKVNELRIGNLVKIDRGIGKVVSIDDPEYENWNEALETPIVVSINGEYYDCIEEEVKGIGITPDFLNLMGFMNGLVNANIYTKGDFSISFANNYFYIFLEERIVRFDFVHELQNLYYSLFQKELDE